MKKLLFAIILAGFALHGNAQEFLDLKRYSTTHPFGTARSMGMGGAIGAIGTDYSVSSINPAALAQIRKSQAMFSIGLNFNSNSSDYIQNNVRDNRFNFSIPNMGLVVSSVLTEKGKEKKTGLVNYSVAFGFNRINDFNRNLTVDANNSGSSYLDFLAEQAGRYVNWANVQNGLTPLYPEELALAANAIVHIDSNQYEANLPQSITMRQNYRVQQSGRQGDWNLSFAGNISNRLYFGAGIAVPGISYHSTETITETSQDPNTPVSFEHNKYVSTTGTGFNAKMGLGLRAADWLRLGIAYHTPTAYSLHDQFSYDFTSRNFTNGQFIYNSGDLLTSDPANFSYKFTTPGKTVLSAAFLYKKLALVSVDYEFVNYLKAQTSTPDLIFINALVKDNMKPSYNLRVGAEFNYYDYRFRAGYGYYASPYSQLILDQVKGNNTALSIYSAGAGYSDPGSGLFFDGAIVVENYKDTYVPYRLETTPRPFEKSTNTVTSTRLVFTIGTRF